MPAKKRRTTHRSKRATAPASPLPGLMIEELPRIWQDGASPDAPRLSHLGAYTHHGKRRTLLFIGVTALSVTIATMWFLTAKNAIHTIWQTPSVPGANLMEQAQTNWQEAEAIVARRLEDNDFDRALTKIQTRGQLEAALFTSLSTLAQGATNTPETNESATPVTTTESSDFATTNTYAE